MQDERQKALLGDLAAQLFWQLSEEIGVSEAADEVVRSGGVVLFEQPFSDAVLVRFGLDRAPPDIAESIFVAVAEEAVAACQEERNLNGIVYVEDLHKGRSPSAEAVDVRAVAVPPRRVEVDGSIEKIGHLCLRHPLPAVVFTSRAPKSTFFEVGDNSNVFGRHIPMFMRGTGLQPAGPDLFIVTGIFHIPVPTVAAGELWNGIIQNSQRFVGGLQAYSEAGKIGISVAW